MKKIYQTPVIKSIFVKNEAMLAGSEKIGLGANTSALGGTVTADAPEIDFDGIISDLGDFDANDNLTFGWE